MDLKEVRDKLGISNTWIAEKFGYANVKSYNKSAGKKRIENLIVELYKKIKENG